MDQQKERIGAPSYDTREGRTHRAEEKGEIVGWIALVVAAVALLLAWTAFNRAPGADIEQVIQSRVDEARDEMRQEYRELESEVRTQTPNVVPGRLDNATDTRATSTQ